MIDRPAKLLAKYGLTRADFEALFHRQGGACAICTEPETADDPLHIDHDHTGADRHIARGLVCTRCAFDLRAYVHGRLPRHDHRLTRYLFRFWHERAAQKNAPEVRRRSTPDYGLEGVVLPRSGPADSGLRRSYHA